IAPGHQRRTCFFDLRLNFRDLDLIKHPFNIIDIAKGFHPALESPAAQWIKVGAVINAFDEKHISKDDFADAVSVNRLVEMAT
ncbi:hypothetical protein, partial [Salmonella enterica]|uniref:hypothetical protein n=1 Tax=Salmonella enterica TaxID=28901 RepID=UPI001594B6B3